jgi:hypothetical protein
MRTLVLLNWLLRVQIVLGIVQFVGMYVGFSWPPPIWAAHRVIALAALAVALVAFRRSAWQSDGRLPPHFRPGLRVAARVVLLAPLALGLCFATGMLGGRGWIAGHVALAVVAIRVIERATAELGRMRLASAAGARGPGAGFRTSKIQTGGTTGD